MGCLSSVNHIERKSQIWKEVKAKNSSADALLGSPKAKQDDFITADYLLRVPIFTRLSDEDRDKLSQSLKEQIFNEGEVIIQEGEAGKKFFIIKQGTCIATSVKTKGDAIESAALMTKGDYFGQNALFTMDKTPATITASTRVVLLCIRSNTFTKLFGENKFKVTFEKRKGITAEKVSKAQDRNVQDRPHGASTVKDDSTVALITSAVADNALFGQFDHTPEQISRIVEEMWRLDVKAGKTLIKQGDRGDYFYVVEYGNFEIFVNNPRQEEDVDILVATCGQGKAFGELALLYNSPRAATVKATIDSVVWAIGRSTFRRVLMHISCGRLAEYEGFLNSVPLFRSLLPHERKSVAEALDTIDYKCGNVIIKQGDTDGDSFYIVQNGEAVVLKQEGSKKSVEVMRLKAGDFFGERALIRKEARAATVKVVSPKMTCLFLDRKSFCALLGPLEDELSRKITSEYDIPINLEQIRKEDRKTERIYKANLEIMGTLGSGAFGLVQLVVDKNTGNSYALKSIHKAMIMEYGHQEHVFSEKNIMLSLDCEFIIRLIETYTDHSHLYFLMELALGGELFSLLRARTVFDDRTARFYSATVVCIFEYMHSKDIIYRDLKPENILLDKMGYLKLTDFGFAKETTERTYTLCGTPDYLAPEVVSGVGHGKGVDWWTLGILTYEMLASCPPFYHKDPVQTYQKILNGHVMFPRSFSKGAKDLVKKLLNKKPTRRLGWVNGRTGRIKEQIWFNTFSWKRLYTREMEAPIVPVIDSNKDLSNFENGQEPEDVPLPEYIDDGSGWDEGFGKIM